MARQTGPIGRMCHEPMCAQASPLLYFQARRCPCLETPGMGGPCHGWTFVIKTCFNADQIPFHCRYMKFAKPLYEIAHSLESPCLRCRNNISVASVQAKPLEQKLPLIRLEDREGFQRQQAHQLCVYIYRMSMKYFSRGYM